MSHPQQVMAGLTLRRLQVKAGPTANCSICIPASITTPSGAYRLWMARSARFCNWLVFSVGAVRAGAGSSRSVR